MIALHRLGRAEDRLYLNPDLIVTVEANPDTVITLTTAAKVVVAESPEQVVAEVKAYRVEILSGALRRRRDRSDNSSGDDRPVPLRPDREPAGGG